MRKTCSVCEELFKDGDKLAAVVLSEFKEIRSEMSFAITKPTDYLEIFHLECYDMGDRQYDEPPEINE